MKPTNPRDNLASPRSPRWLDRRELLRHLGIGIAALPILQAACGGSQSTGIDGGAGSGDASPDGANPSDIDAATATADAAPGAADAAPAGDWATGGTDSMTDKDTYPDPFTGDVTACVLVASTTAGPCTTTNDLDREDVSEGWTGLPVRLALKVVDADCAPVAGAVVKIWHTNIEGVYSGATPNPAQCSANDAEAIAADFFRGVQTTAADGTVFFDTCYPGWYGGRAIHIHFQVKSGNTSYRISQLFFPEDVTEDIFARHPEYSPFGQPDTTNSSDGISRNIDAVALERLTFTVARMTDGAMMASKVVTVTS